MAALLLLQRKVATSRAPFDTRSALLRVRVAQGRTFRYGLPAGAPSGSKVLCDAFPSPTLRCNIRVHKRVTSPGHAGGLRTGSRGPSARRRRWGNNTFMNP